MILLSSFSFFTQQRDYDPWLQSFTLLEIPSTTDLLLLSFYPFGRITAYKSKKLPFSYLYLEQLRIRREDYTIRKMGINKSWQWHYLSRHLIVTTSSACFSIFLMVTHTFSILPNIWLTLPHFQISHICYKEKEIWIV